MNRPTGSPGEIAVPFRVGDWVAVPARDLLVRGAEQVKIEPRTMEVLCRLARQPGVVVSQAELEADVWTGVIVTSQSVYQAIAQLRRVLGDNPREPQYIETVPRRGYRLIAPVEAETVGTVAGRTSPGGVGHLLRIGLAESYPAAVCRNERKVGGAAGCKLGASDARHAVLLQCSRHTAVRGRGQSRGRALQHSRPVAA